jgi:hypothetical protein
VEPSSRGAFLAALEGDLQVLLLAAAAQCQPNVRKVFALIMSRRVEIPEQPGIRRDAKAAHT